MNAHMHYEKQQEEVSPLRVVKSDLKVFNIRYLNTLNLITVVGWSITDDAWIQYCQMLADIEAHLLKNEELKIYFKLELFNTSSAGYLFRIIKRLNRAHARGKQVRIYWSCAAACNEDEIIDAGLDMAGMCEFKFQITQA